MTRKLLTVTLLLTSGFFQLFGQSQGTAESTHDPVQVVINHAMIERFNQAEFDTTALNFQDIIQSYSLEDVKLLVHTYHNSDYIYEDKYRTDEKLAELKGQMDQDAIPNRKLNSLVTDNTLIR